MGIACLLRATSCPVSTLPLPEHWLTSRADSTQYSAKQMRVKKRNPINTGLFPCTACVCVTVQHAVKVKLHTAGEREALIRQSEDTLDPGHTSRVGCGNGRQPLCKRTRLIKAGRQADRDRGTRSGSAWWALVSAPWRASVDTFEPLTALQDGGGGDVSLSFLKEGRRDRNRNK